jgi:hypothetical protein
MSFSHESPEVKLGTLPSTLNERRLSEELLGTSAPEPPCACANALPMGKGVNTRPFFWRAVEPRDGDDRGDNVGDATGDRSSIAFARGTFAGLGPQPSISSGTDSRLVAGSSKI